MVDIRSTVDYSKASSHLHHSLPSNHIFSAELCQQSSSIGRASTVAIYLLQNISGAKTFLLLLFVTNKTMCKTKHDTRRFSYKFCSYWPFPCTVPNIFTIPFLLLCILDSREHCANSSFRLITIRLNNNIFRPKTWCSLCIHVVFGGRDFSMDFRRYSQFDSRWAHHRCNSNQNASKLHIWKHENDGQ